MKRRLIKKRKTNLVFEGTPISIEDLDKENSIIES